jgi:hypothetical protein
MLVSLPDGYEERRKLIETLRSFGLTVEEVHPQ